MLPMLMMLVAGFLAKQGGTSAAAAPAGGPADILGGLLGGGRAQAPTTGAGLGSLLDLDRDGNPLDDILEMAGKLMR